MKIIGLDPLPLCVYALSCKTFRRYKRKVDDPTRLRASAKAQSVSKVVVATDHREIFDHVLSIRRRRMYDKRKSCQRNGPLL